jgi:ABC-type lipoprotein release transport system permease subunit
MSRGLLATALASLAAVAPALRAGRLDPATAIRNG